MISLPWGDSNWKNDVQGRAPLEVFDSLFYAWAKLCIYSQVPYLSVGIEDLALMATMAVKKWSKDYQFSWI